MNFKVKDLLITVLPEEADRNELCALHTRVCLDPTANPCADCTLLVTWDCGVCTKLSTGCLYPTKQGTCCVGITCGVCTQGPTCVGCTVLATPCIFPTDDPCGVCSNLGTFCRIPTDDPCGSCTKLGTFCQIPTDDPCGGCTKLGTFCMIPTEDPCGCTRIGTECQFGTKGPCIGGTIGPCIGSHEPWIRVRNAEDIAALRASLKATLEKLDKLDASALRGPDAEPQDLDALERRLKEALQEVRKAKSQDRDKGDRDEP